MGSTASLTAIVRSLFAIHGVHGAIVSDPGPQLATVVVARFCGSAAIEHRLVQPDNHNYIGEAKRDEHIPKDTEQVSERWSASGRGYTEPAPGIPLYLSPGNGSVTCASPDGEVHCARHRIQWLRSDWKRRQVGMRGT